MSSKTTFLSTWQTGSSYSSHEHLHEVVKELAEVKGSFYEPVTKNTSLQMHTLNAQLKW